MPSEVVVMQARLNSAVLCVMLSIKARLYWAQCTLARRSVHLLVYIPVLPLKAIMIHTLDRTPTEARPLPLLLRGCPFLLRSIPTGCTLLLLRILAMVRVLLSRLPRLPQKPQFVVPRTLRFLRLLLPLPLQGAAGHNGTSLIGNHLFLRQLPPQRLPQLLARRLLQRHRPVRLRLQPQPRPLQPPRLPLAQLLLMLRLPWLLFLPLVLRIIGRLC